MRATADSTSTGTSTMTEARADGMRCVVVASRFNGEIVEKLVEGALHALEVRGAKRSKQTVVWVPGALEIPAVVKALVTKKGKRPDAVVCVGCVIKGGTDHYEHVCRATTDGIMQVALDAIAGGKGPVVTNGVLTVASEQQARERAGGTVGNKGTEAALAAIETHAVLRGIGSV